MVVAEPQGCPVLCSRGTAADLTEVKDMIASAFLPFRRGWISAGVDLCSQFLHLSTRVQKGSQNSQV